MEHSVSPQHIRIGVIGERIAEKYLESKDFRVIERNYGKKWGEIDLILEKGGIVHFVEVKTRSYKTRGKLLREVSYETSGPAENVHPEKLRRLHRAIETWLAERKHKGHFQLDIASVRLVYDDKYAVVEMLDNAIG